MRHSSVGSAAACRQLPKRGRAWRSSYVIMVMMLCSALMVGFVTAIVADQRASGLDRDQTQAYAAAHAGLEQLTSDLSDLFTTDFSPSAPQIDRADGDAAVAARIQVPRSRTAAPATASASTPNAAGQPGAEIPNGSTITAGPYQGFRGIITPYDITVTAGLSGGNCDHAGGAEVRMRRSCRPSRSRSSSSACSRRTTWLLRRAQLQLRRPRAYQRQLYLAAGNGRR